jgi:hypothetical protein
MEPLTVCADRGHRTGIQGLEIDHERDLHTPTEVDLNAVAFRGHCQVDGGDYSG